MRPQLQPSFPLLPRCLNSSLSSYHSHCCPESSLRLDHHQGCHRLELYFLSPSGCVYSSLPFFHPQDVPDSRLTFYRAQGCPDSYHSEAFLDSSLPFYYPQDCHNSSLPLYHSGLPQLQLPSLSLSGLPRLLYTQACPDPASLSTILRTAPIPASLFSLSQVFGFQ
jgi:hypothetical protein